MLNKNDKETSQLTHKDFEHCTKCNSILDVRNNTLFEEQIINVEECGQLYKICYYEIFVKKGS